MCEMGSKEGEPTSCPDCGRLICFDFKGFDDVYSRAVVTSGGDVLCIPCCRRWEEEEERMCEEEAAFFWNDPQDDVYEV